MTDPGWRDQQMSSVTLPDAWSELAWPEAVQAAEAAGWPDGRSPYFDLFDYDSLAGASVMGIAYRAGVRTLGELADTVVAAAAATDLLRRLAEVIAAILTAAVGR